jgi:putative hydrolase of the HAD superfamily
MIKTIIFDIGGVVVFTDFQRLYEGFALSAGIDSEFIRQYHKANWDDLLCGKIDLDRFFADMKKEAKNQNQDLKSLWVEEAKKCRKDNSELLQIIQDLRKSYSVGVLTNLSATRKMVDELDSLYEHFDYALLSCDVGLQKPDVRFFQMALDKAGAEAHEAVFVDDNPKFFTGAEELGIPSIIYKDNVSFLKQLNGIFEIEKLAEKIPNIS